ncbi:MAG: universal stress protein [Chitinophagaceae bacterium]
MNSILLPTDFSNMADNALDYAISFAKDYTFDIHLLHTIMLGTIGVAANSIYVEDSTEHLELKAQEKMNEKIAALQSKYPEINFHSSIKFGTVFNSLEELCNEVKPILVIMGISGDGSTIDKMIGSNAIHAMKFLNCPVLIIPKKGQYHTIQKIGLACDLKNVLNAIPIAPLKAFSKLFNANVEVLHIDYHNKNFTSQTPVELKNAEELFIDIPHTFHFIEDKDTQHAIDQFIDSEQIDMMITIPKKYSFFEQLFHKSASKEMAYHTHIPLLALHMS